MGAHKSSDPIEVLRLAAANAALAIRNCVNAGQIGAGYQQYADDLESALASLSCRYPDCGCRSVMGSAGAAEVCPLAAPKPESAEAVATVIGYGSDSGDVVEWHREDIAPGTKLYTAPPRPEASYENVLCRECGQPTMHMGSICYACSHPAPQQASAPVGAAEDMVLDAIERRESSAPVGVEGLLVEAVEVGTLCNLAAEVTLDAGNVATAEALSKGALTITRLAQALAQQPAAVDEAMVERAAEAAWLEFKSGLEERSWERAPAVRKDRLRIIVRTALTAALAGQQHRGTP